MKRAPGEAAEAAVEDPMNCALGEAEEAVEAVVDDLTNRALCEVAEVVKVASGGVYANDVHRRLWLFLFSQTKTYRA